MDDHTKTQRGGTAPLMPTPIKWSAARYRTFLFDCDGVLWHDDTPYPDSHLLVQRLRSLGHRLVFVTNNSSRSRRHFAEKLARMKLISADDAEAIEKATREGDETPLGSSHPLRNVLTACFAAAHFLQGCRHFDRSTHRALVVGGSGIGDELQRVGIRSISSRELVGTGLSRERLGKWPVDEAVRAVVVGIDEQLTYAAITLAALHLRGRPYVLFIATNRDATFPTDGHLLPGSGTCVDAICTASGREPINVGKPELYMFHLADVSDREQCVVIGDRLDTDIAFGQRANVDTVLVLTGVSSESDVHAPGNTIKPTFILPSVNELLSVSESNHTTTNDHNKDSTLSSNVLNDFMTSQKQHVIIIPGCGCTPVETSNWYTWLTKALNTSPLIDAVCLEMPDPIKARKSIWLPFIKSVLKPHRGSILIGHSSGAEACMRYCETEHVLGMILVSACHTDLGDESEKASGWYDEPWQWEEIKNHTRWIVQLHSRDDHCIPISEAEHVHRNLESEFIVHSKHGHYLRKELPELISIVESKLG